MHKDTLYRLENLLVEFDISVPPNFYRQFEKIISLHTIDVFPESDSTDFFKDLETKYRLLREHLESASNLLEEPAFKHQLSYSLFKSLDENEKNDGTEQRCKSQIEDCVSSLNLLIKLLQDSKNPFVQPNKKSGPDNKHKTVLASNVAFLMICGLGKFPTTTKDGLFENIYRIACEEIGETPGDTVEIIGKAVRDMKKNKTVNC